MDLTELQSLLTNELSSTDMKSSLMHKLTFDLNVGFLQLTIELDELVQVEF